MDSDKGRAGDKRGTGPNAKLHTAGPTLFGEAVIYMVALLIIRREHNLRHTIRKTAGFCTHCNNNIQVSCPAHEVSLFLNGQLSNHH